ncbi:SH3 domain-containing protein [Hydrocarboniphaga sp.]|uniref:SH3 domain-containing protein n=1 Tax=Hydrocarboniphaga sp. TaxID=2033016 RepID=UPI003D099986
MSTPRRWILACCCALLPLAAHAEPAPSIEILAAFVELHTSPDERYPIHEIAERGEQVRVLKRQTRWYKLRTPSGKQGWVSETQLGPSLTAAGYALSTSDQ